MPNHITNRIRITGNPEDAQKLYDFIKSDEKDSDGEISVIDFNKIVPMPDSLDISSSSEGEDGKRYLLGMAGNILERQAYQKSDHFKKMETMKVENPKWFEKHMELGRQYLNNIATYGYANWYNWRLANWGTKWNAYESYIDGDGAICFQTAWSGVPDLIAQLAAKFPSLTIEYDFADENTGWNVGSYIMNGDEVEDISPADDSAEAWALVFDLGVADRDDYEEQPDGSYAYKED